MYFLLYLEVITSSLIKYLYVYIKNLNKHCTAKQVGDLGQYVIGQYV